MALIYRVTVCGNLDSIGKPNVRRVVHDEEYFSVVDALRAIERIAKKNGWRRFELTTVEVDIPGIGELAGALDSSGPGFEKYKAWSVH